MNHDLKIENMFPNGPGVSMFAFAHKEGANLSLRGTGDTKNLRETHPDVYAALFSVPHVLNYYAPAPTEMNGLIVPKGHLQTCIPVTDYVNMYRGVNADGVCGLQSGDAFGMSPANCMLIVACGYNGSRNYKIIASHAGRNSVIDPANLDRPSVVDNIIAQMMNDGLWPGDLRVWIGFSISPGEHFEHVVGDERWPNNGILVDYARSLGDGCVANNGTPDNPDFGRGWLDLKRMAMCQFIRAGVLPENITLDDVCTHTDKNNDAPKWGSHIRGEHQRNLVVVRVD
jgi:copper oxidase (laccase) domain-containing protein